MAKVDGEPGLNRPGLAVVRKPGVQRVPSYIILPRASFRSPIREALAVASQPDMDSVAGGLPLNSTIARSLEVLGPLIAKYLGPEHAAENNYGGSPGEERARRMGADLLKRRGIDVDWTRVYISPAATPADTALAEAGLPEYGNGVAIVEGPTYPGGIAALWKRGPEFKQIRMDKDGPLPEDLRAALEDATENPSKPNVVWYTTLTGSTFGITATAERRAEYARVIKEFAQPDRLGERLLVIEDDPYPDINLVGKPAPRPLTSYLQAEGLDEAVAYVKTFSKDVNPDVRTGLVVPPPRLAASYQSIAESLFLFHNRATQLGLADYYESGAYDTHVATLGEDYLPSRNAMNEALAENAERANWTWTAPDYGFFYGVTVETPEGEQPIDMDQLFGAISTGRRAAYIPGKRLFIASEDSAGRQAASMRMALSYPPEQIHRAVGKIADGIIQAREETRRGR